MEDAFLRKYPCVCPYCFSSPCVCILTKKRPSISLSFADEEQELRDKYTIVINDKANVSMTFEKVFSIIMKIYPNNACDWKHHGVAFHMIKTGEELAELHEACCRREKYGSTKDTATMLCVSDEMADVFAWMISEWGLWRNAAGMTEAFSQHYSSGCSRCHKKIDCKCQPREEHDTLLCSEYTKHTVESLLSILQGDEVLKNTFGIGFINGFMKDIREASSERQIDSITDKLIKSIGERLRRVEIDQRIRTEVFDTIALLEDAISKTHRYS